MKLTAPRMVAAAMAAVVGLLTLPGCGGGGTHIQGSAASRAKGTATFKLTWPKTTRVIPIAAQSVIVTLKDTATGEVFTQTLTPPASGVTPRVSTATFTGLNLDTYLVTAQAFPNPDGSGVLQASATQTVTIQPGSNNLDMTMDATVQSVTVSVVPNPPNLFVGVGTTRQLVATAWDGPNGTGNVVITQLAGGGASDTSLKFSASSGNATVDPNTGLVTGVSAGPVTITAQYTEPNITPGTSGTPANASASVSFNIVNVGLAQSAWAKFHADSQNTGMGKTGVPNASGTAPGSANWPFTTSREVEFSSPAVAPDGKTIYVGANDGILYAVYSDSSNAATYGTLKWKLQTGDMIESSPAVGADGTIYVGSYDGKLYAGKDSIDPNTSQPAFVPTFTFTAAGPIHSSPVLDSFSNVYFGTTAGTGAGGVFYKVDGITGFEKWHNNSAADGIFSSPSLNAAENTVYFSSADSMLYGLKTSDGTVSVSVQVGIQSFDLTSKIPAQLYTSSPSIGNVPGVGEVVFIGGLDGRLYAFNAATLGGAWSITQGSGNVESSVSLQGGQIYGTPAIQKDASGMATAVYVGTFDNTSGTFIPVVTKLDPATGSITWTTSSNIIAGNSQFFGTQGFTSSPAISGDGSLLYIGAYDGNVYGLSTADGTISWKFTTVPPTGQANQFDSSPGIGPDGTVYIGGVTGINNGRVYAIK